MSHKGVMMLATQLSLHITASMRKCLGFNCVNGYRPLLTHSEINLVFVSVL